MTQIEVKRLGEVSMLWPVMCGLIVSSLVYSLAYGLDELGRYLAACMVAALTTALVAKGELMSRAREIKLESQIDD